MCARPYRVKQADADVPEEITVTITWPAAIKERLLACEAEGYTKGTIKTVKSVLHTFQDYCVKNGCKYPTDVTRHHVRSYIAWLSEQSYAPRYINNHLSRIRGLYAYLVDEDYMRGGDDPTYKIKFLKTGKPLIVVYNTEEVKQLLEAASKQKNKYFAVRDTLIIMLMADCGLRVHEVANMESDWIIKDKLLVDGKGNKQRMLYLTPKVLRQISKYQRVKEAYFSNKPKLAIKNDKFFKGRDGYPIKNDCVQKMLKRLAKSDYCNLRPEVRNSPHTLRHWFAQQQLLNGVDLLTLSRLLGHESIATTQSYLRGIADETLVESAVQTSPLNNM